MTKITKDNYEAFLLDFSEGNLSEELQRELELFLFQHPELGIDMNESYFLKLDKEEEVFQDKMDLKKSIYDLVQENQLISYIEDQLTDTEKQFIEKSCLQNPELGKALKLYQQTKLETNVSIIYPDRQKLKHQSKIIWFNFSASRFAAAASVLFLIGLIVFWANSKHKSEIAMTKQTTKPERFIYKEKTHSDPQQHLARTSLPKYTNAPGLRVEHAALVNKQKEMVATISATPINEFHSQEINNDTSILAIHIPDTNIDSSKHQEIKFTTNPKSVVRVVIEYDDENPISFPAQSHKKNIWMIASKALKKLNWVGVKSVDGKEEKDHHTTKYDLSIGAFNITYKTSGKL